MNTLFGGNINLGGLISVCLISIVLTGCGQTETEDDKQLFEVQEQALEKAKTVEEQILDAAEKQKEIIEEQSR